MPDRDIRKKNPKRSAAALRERLALEKTFGELDRKPNKTPEEKQELGRVKKRLAHLRRKQEQKSEPHARKGERH